MAKIIRSHFILILMFSLGLYAGDIDKDSLIESMTRVKFVNSVFAHEPYLELLHNGKIPEDEIESYFKTREKGQELLTNTEEGEVIKIPFELIHPGQNELGIGNAAAKITKTNTDDNSKARDKFQDYLDGKSNIDLLSQIHPHDKFPGSKVEPINVIIGPTEIDPITGKSRYQAVLLDRHHEIHSILANELSYHFAKMMVEASENEEFKSLRRNPLKIYIKVVHIYKDITPDEFWFQLYKNNLAWLEAPTIKGQSFDTDNSKLTPIESAAKLKQNLMNHKMVDSGRQVAKPPVYFSELINNDFRTLASEVGLRMRKKKSNKDWKKSSSMKGSHFAWVKAVEAAPNFVEFRIIGATLQKAFEELGVTYLSYEPLNDNIINIARWALLREKFIFNNPEFEDIYLLTDDTPNKLEEVNNQKLDSDLKNYYFKLDKLIKNSYPKTAIYCENFEFQTQ